MIRMSNSGTARTPMVVAFALLALSLTGFVRPESTRAEDGWSLSKLNPFGSSEPKTKPKPSKAKAKTPSTWTTVKNGTSDAYTKTKHTLMPWTKPTPASRTSVASRSKTTPTKKTGGRTEEKSWYEFWKSEPEPPKRPRTVQEWLDQPRPE